MRQLQLFTPAELAVMRDRTASRNYSAERDEFRRTHQRHRTWGLARRHAERLRRLRSGERQPPEATERNAEEQSKTVAPTARAALARSGSRSAPPQPSRQSSTDPGANISTGRNAPRHLTNRNFRPAAPAIPRRTPPAVGPATTTPRAPTDKAQTIVAQPQVQAGQDSESSEARRGQDQTVRGQARQTEQFKARHGKSGACTQHQPGKTRQSEGRARQDEQQHQPRPSQQSKGQAGQDEQHQPRRSQQSEGLAEAIPQRQGLAAQGQSARIGTGPSSRHATAEKVDIVRRPGQTRRRPIGCSSSPAQRLVRRSGDAITPPTTRPSGWVRPRARRWRGRRRAHIRCRCDRARHPSRGFHRRAGFTRTADFKRSRTRDGASSSQPSRKVPDSFRMTRKSSTWARLEHGRTTDRATGHNRLSGGNRQKAYRPFPGGTRY